MKDSSNDKKVLKALFSYSQLGVSMAMCVVLGFLTGEFLDRKLSTSPVFLIVFIIMGVIASYRTLYRISQREWKGKE